MKRAIATVIVALSWAYTAGLVQAADPLPDIRSTADTWPLFRGDSFASGVAPGTLPESLEVLWRYEVPQGAFEGTPVIANGVVYIGDVDGALYALDLATGKEQWAFRTESGFLAAPAFSEGRVFIGDYDGRFHCVDATSGEEIWDFEAAAEINSSGNFFEGNVLFGSQDASLYCLKVADGTLVWKHTIQDQIRCSPTLVEGRCFVAGCDGALHIIDLRSGEATSSVPIDSPTGVTPAVSGDDVFFGTEAGEILGINWREAKQKWSYADPRSAQPVRSSPAVRDGVMVIGGRGKKVYALDTKSGELKWFFPIRSRVDSSPVIVQNRVFVGSSDGRLYALNIQNGEKLWEYETGAGFIGSPAVADQRLVIASDAGVVYCFGASASTPE